MQNKGLYTDLGLTEKQALIYDHLLSHGPHTIAKLTEETHLHRGIVFFILKQLIQRKVVEKTKANNKDAYVSTHPDNLLRIFEEREKQIEKSKTQLAAELPALITNYSLTTAKPGVTYFEGATNIQKVHEDILRVGKSYKIIFTSLEGYEKYTKEITTPLFRQRSRQEKITYKLLTKTSPEALIEYGNQSKPELTRFVSPELLTTPAEMIIYGQKVALISFHPTLVATVIDNQDINQTFNQLFDYIWATTKAYHDKIVKAVTSR